MWFLVEIIGLSNEVAGRGTTYTWGQEGGSALLKLDQMCARVRMSQNAKVALAL